MAVHTVLYRLQQRLYYGKNITQATLCRFYNHHGAYGVMVSTGVCGAPSPGSNPGRHPITNKRAVFTARLFVIRSRLLGFEPVGGRGRRNAPVEEVIRNRGFRKRNE